MMVYEDKEKSGMEESSSICWVDVHDDNSHVGYTTHGARRIEHPRDDDNHGDGWDGDDNP
jgi:hypothetical protein